MPDLVPIIRRFSGHEFEIRRLYSHDPEFRAICEDYAAATRALAFWEKDRSKAEDYRELIRELEEEVFAHLADPQRSAGRPPGNRR